MENAENELWKIRYELCPDLTFPPKTLKKIKQTMTFSGVPKDIQILIKNVPQGFNDILKHFESLMFYIRDYQDVLREFNQIYDVYKKNIEEKDRTEFNAIVKEWQTKISNSFPQVEELLDFLNQEIEKNQNIINGLGNVMQGLEPYDERFVGRLLLSWDSLKESYKSLKLKTPEKVSSRQFLTILIEKYGAFAPFNSRVAQKVAGK